MWLYTVPVAMPYLLSSVSVCMAGGSPCPRSDTVANRPWSEHDTRMLPDASRDVEEFVAVVARVPGAVLVAVALWLADVLTECMGSGHAPS